MSGRAELVARHVSPDGRLIWRVEREIEPDGRTTLSCGFEAKPWHLHPEDLRRSGEPLEKVLSLTWELITDQLLVVEESWRPPGAEAGIDVELRLFGPFEDELEFKANDENWRFRFWSGREVLVDDLLNGRVAYIPLDQKLLASD